MKKILFMFALVATTLFTMTSCEKEDPIVNLTCTVTHTDVTVYDGNDGTITVTVDTGNGDYEFSLNSTTTSTDGKFTGLTAGDYNVSVTDKENKTWTKTVTINQPDADELLCTVTPTNVTTFGGNDGTITVTVVSGYEPFTFTLNDNITSEDGVFTGLVANTYNLKVVDDLDREFTQSVTITEPGQLTMSIEHTNVSCFGESNGTITVTASGETGVYEYKLNDGTYQSDNVFTDLSADTYTVYVKSGDVTISDDVTITQPTEPLTFLGDPIVTQPTNYGLNGTITVTATGGTSPYQYQLDNGSFGSSNVLNAPVGTHTVTAKDANSCTITTDNIVIAYTTVYSPVIQIVNVTDVTRTSAKLNFKIAPYGTTTSFYIEYGLTPEYGNTIELSNVTGGTDFIDVSKNIDGLTHGKVYQYRIVAENSFGTGEVTGTFTTRYDIGDDVDGGKVYFIQYFNDDGEYFYIIKNQDEEGLFNRDYVASLPGVLQGWGVLEMPIDHKDEIVSNINSLSGSDGFTSPVENDKYWCSFGGIMTITFPNGNTEPRVEGESYRLRLCKIIYMMN